MLFSFFNTQKHGIVNISENGDSPEEKQVATCVASKDNEKKRGGRWNRLTFKIVLSYHGGSFDGWQKQPGLNTVQGYCQVIIWNIHVLVC